MCLIQLLRRSTASKPSSRLLLAGSSDLLEDTLEAGPINFIDLCAGVYEVHTMNAVFIEQHRMIV